MQITLSLPDGRALTREISDFDTTQRSDDYLWAEAATRLAQQEKTVVAATTDDMSTFTARIFVPGEQSELVEATAHSIEKFLDQNVTRSKGRRLVETRANRSWLYEWEIGGKHNGITCSAIVTEV